MGYTVDAFEGVYDSLHATSLSSQDGGRGEGDDTFDFEMPASTVISFFVLYGDGSVRRRVALSTYRACQRQIKTFHEVSLSRVLVRGSFFEFSCPTLKYLCVFFLFIF